MSHLLQAHDMRNIVLWTLGLYGLPTSMVGTMRSESTRRDMFDMPTSDTSKGRPGNPGKGYATSSSIAR